MDKKKLNTENLENISGGAIYDSLNLANRNEATRYEVIDDNTGAVLCSCDNLENAKIFADSLGLSTYEIQKYSTLEKRRNNPVDNTWSEK